MQRFFGGAARRRSARTASGVIYSSDEDIARRADEDNENDEYHVPVSPLDVWAEYHRLREEEKWELAQIGEAKRENGKPVDDSVVSARIQLHTRCPEQARQAILDGMFGEGHCLAVITVVLDVKNLEPWLTTAQAQAELVTDVLSKHRGKGPDDKKPTVKVVREHAKRWKELIAAAEAAYARLDESGVWRRAAPRRRRPRAATSAQNRRSGLRSTKCRAGSAIWTTRRRLCSWCWRTRRANWRRWSMGFTS